jgi:hypothetical protein
LDKSLCYYPKQHLCSSFLSFQLKLMSAIKSWFLQREQYNSFPLQNQKMFMLLHSLIELSNSYQLWTNHTFGPNTSTMIVRQFIKKFTINTQLGVTCS